MTISQSELEAARRRSAADFTAGAISAGFIEAPAEVSPSDSAAPGPVLEEQWPSASNEPPAGGWATPAGRLLGVGWKPEKVDPVLGELLRKREALEWGLREAAASKLHAPDQVWIEANKGNAAGVLAEIHAAGDSKWIDAESGLDSNLFRWRWRNDEGRMERLWLFGPAILTSLAHFEGVDADAVREEVRLIGSHPSPPKPPTTSMRPW